MWEFTLCKNISLQSTVFTAAEQTHVDNHTHRTDDRRHENVPLGDITLYVSWWIAKVCILRHLLCDLERCPWALWAWRVAGSHIQCEKHTATGAISLSRAPGETALEKTTLLVLHTG